MKKVIVSLVLVIVSSLIFSCKSATLSDAFRTDSQVMKSKSCDMQSQLLSQLNPEMVCTISNRDGRTAYIFNLSKKECKRVLDSLNGQRTGMRVTKYVQ